MILAYLYYRNKGSKSSSFFSKTSKKNPFVEELFETDIGRAAFSFLIGMAASTLFFDKCEGVDCVQFRGPIYDEIDNSVFVYNEDECVHNKMVPVDCDVSKRIVPFAENSPETSMQKNATFPVKIIPAAKFNLELEHPAPSHVSESSKPVLSKNVS